MQKKLFGVEEAGIQFIDETQRKTHDCASNWKWGGLFLGVYLCFLGKVCSLYTHTIPHQPPPPQCQIVPSIQTENLPQITWSPLTPTQWTSTPSGHMSPYLSSQKQLVLPLLRSRSAKKKKKKIKPHTVASGWERATQASAPNHPLPRQHSSRQQLQQINLLLTVHLDWINLELGAITAIGRRGYSPNAGCYPALGIKKRSQLFFFSPVSL